MKRDKGEQYRHNDCHDSQMNGTDGEPRRKVNVTYLFSINEAAACPTRRFFFVATIATSLFTRSVTGTALGGVLTTRAVIGARLVVVRATTVCVCFGKEECGDEAEQQHTANAKVKAPGHAYCLLFEKPVRRSGFSCFTRPNKVKGGKRKPCPFLGAG